MLKIDNQQMNGEKFYSRSSTCQLNGEYCPEKQAKKMNMVAL
jgi:hypothetical protein